jgi:plasmid stabilization system protein ParE
LSLPVRLSPRALEDLDRLPEFLQLINPRAARQVREVLIAGLSSLAEFPDRGHPTELAGYRELSLGFGRYGYVARYRVERAEVLITRIFHAREQR